MKEYTFEIGTNLRAAIVWVAIASVLIAWIVG